MIFDVRSSPEWQLRKRLDVFAFSVELLQRNYDELFMILAGFEPVQNPTILAVSEKWKRKELLKEISFRLHNYLASAKSLLDHCRTMYRQEYEKSGAFPEYPVEVKNRFENDGLVQFVHGLREMEQHYKLLTVSSVTTLSGGIANIAFVLRKTDLLKYSSWKSIARAYLEQIESEQVYIRDICATYHERIIAFYGWLFAALQKIHTSEFEKLHTLQREELQQNAAEIIRTLDHDLSCAKAVTSGSIRDILYALLTPAEQRDLYEHENNPPGWLEAALAVVKSRIQIPPELVARLRRFAGAVRDKEPGRIGLEPGSSGRS